MAKVPHLARSMVAGAALTSSGCAAIVGADFDVAPRSNSASNPNPTPTAMFPGPSAVASWRVEPSDGETRLLGLAVAVQGDTILAGASDSVWAGRAYVATRQFDDTWQVDQTLTAEEYALPNGEFGDGVAISGDWAVVGAPGNRTADPPRSGSAFFFHRSTGTWLRAEGPIQAPTPATDDAFGARVAIDGDVALIGAPGNQLGKSYLGRLGAVYLYTRGTNDIWSLADTIAPADGAPGDQFGFELALGPDVLVVGAPGAAERGTAAGAAYSYARQGSTFSHDPQKLLPRAAEAAGTGLGFGTIGLDGDLLLVPARSRPLPPHVEAYTRDASGTWHPDALEPPAGLDPASTDWWRASVRGTTAILALSMFGGVGVGLVYERSNGTWQFRERLVSGTSAQDRFGWTIAYDGSTACFGGIFFGGQEGAVYVFDAVR